MKAAFRFCLLCVIPLFPQVLLSQKVAPKVQTGSRVPSVTIRFMATKGSDYEFSIQNRSGHAITAFDVLLVPKGIARKKNDHFSCHGRCSQASEIDTIEHPAIKAGGAAQVTYDADEIAGGAVVLESVIFDDGSYAGNERIAAYLLAQQLGQQSQFDNIVSAVEQTMATTGPQNSSKADRIYGALGALPAAPDSATMATFDRWFPNVRDCSSRFPQIMKDAATHEAQEVQARLQPLLPNGGPTETALTQWWTGTQEYLTAFGCNQCTIALQNPTPPVRQRTISVGCSGTQTPGSSGGATLKAGLSDDSESDDSSGDGSDQSASNDADSSNAGQDDDDALSMTEEPVDPATANTPAANGASTSAASASTANAGGATPSASSSVSTSTSSYALPALSSVTTRSHHTPIPPRLHPLGGIRPLPSSQSGATQSGDEALRPVPDEQIYPQYFRYVVAYTKYLANGGMPTPDANNGQSPDPFSAKMGDSDRNIVTSAAYDCDQALQEFMRKNRPSSIATDTDETIADSPTATGSAAPVSTTRPATQSRVVPFPWQPPTAQGIEARHRMEERLDGRAGIVEATLKDLRTRLTRTSFRAFESYVHELYQTRPGRLVREPLPENTMLTNYLHYTVWLSKSAMNTGEAAQAAIRTRDEEQKASALSDKDEATLQQLGEDFLESLRDLGHEAAERAAKSRRENETSTRDATGTSETSTASETTQPATSQAGTMHPAATSTPARADLTAERKLLSDSYAEQLKSKLTPASFKRLQKRVHALYDPVTVRRIVPVTGSEPKPKQAKARASVPTSR